MSQSIRLPVRGGTVLIDEDDLELVGGHRWWFQGPLEYRYAARWTTGIPRSDRRIILMHRVITDAPSGMSVDHINGDTLDNRRSNLRVCSQMENLRNRKRNSNNKAGFKGVYFDKYRGLWGAEIAADRRRYHLGRFNTPEEAAAAYDEAARRLHGAFARTNEAA